MATGRRSSQSTATLTVELILLVTVKELRPEMSWRKQGFLGLMGRRYWSRRQAYFCNQEHEVLR